MFLELRAHRCRRADVGFVEVRDVGGRLGRWRIEQIVEHPLAAKHWRGSRGVRGDGEDAALGQHAGPRRRRQIDLAELRSRHIRDAVVARQALVQERVAPVDEVEHAAVVPDNRLDEELGFPTHRQTQVVLELRELVAVARQRLEGAELQPLAAEVLRQCMRLRIPQHPPDLERKDLRVAQRPRVGRLAELGVGHARPEEVRQPSGQLVRREAIDAGDATGQRPARPIAFDPEEKVWRHQDRLNADRQALLERPFLLLRRLGQDDVFFDLPRRDGTAEGAAREAGHDPGHTRRLMLAVQVAARVDLLETRPRRSLCVRIGPTNLDDVHADAVQRDLRELRSRVIEALAELLEPLWRHIVRRRERTRRIRPRRRVRPRVSNRQPFVDSRDGDRDPVVAGRQADFHLDSLSAEILPIVGKRRRALLIVGRGLHQLLVNPQRDRDRVGRFRAQPPQHYADEVFAVDGNAVHRVECVGNAQPGHVVGGRNLHLINDSAAFRPQPSQGRFHWRRSEHCDPRHPIRGRHVLFHEHW
jgi:hypothetical protein